MKLSVSALSGLQVFCLTSQYSYKMHSPPWQLLGHPVVKSNPCSKDILRSMNYGPQTKVGHWSLCLKSKYPDILNRFLGSWKSFFDQKGPKRYYCCSPQQRMTESCSSCKFRVFRTGQYSVLEQRLTIIGISRHSQI